LNSNNYLLVIQFEGTATSPLIELLGYMLCDGETAGGGKQELSSPKYPERPCEHSGYSLNLIYQLMHFYI